MNLMWRKTNKLMKIINYSLINLPTPSNLNNWWNFGSLLGLCLLIQLITGIILSMHYNANIMLAFNSINHIIRDMNYGWLMRTLHSNGASMFFICLFLHTGRGIYYGSYFYIQTWLIGVIIMLLTMATAFMGYVLPWGQMSFWGATVITNLLSAIPYLGKDMVIWIWGDFAVSNTTLMRFFSIHFILPFIISMTAMIHLFFLHQTGSSNPLGFKPNLDKIPFHPFFTIKDILGFIIMLLTLITITMIEPYMLADPDNFIPANPMVTPTHIQPEWYFLFAYSILRAIPNKLGGVIALIMSILILMILPFSMNPKFKGLEFYPINQMMFWIYTNNIILLTWIGTCPVEEPYMFTGLMLTTTYFMYFIINPLMTYYWDKIIN